MSFVIILQLLSLFVTLACFSVTVFQRSGKTMSYVIMLMVQGVAVNLANLGVLRASDLTDVLFYYRMLMALVTIQIPLYTGFAALAGDVRLPRWARDIFAFYGIFMSTFTSLSIGRDGLIYKSVNVGHANGYSYFYRTNGPLHILISIGTIVFLIVDIAICIISIRKKKNSDNPAYFAVILSTLLPWVFYGIQYIMKLRIEMTVFSTPFVAVGIVFILHGHFFNIESIGVAAMFKNSPNAYIITDSDGRIIDINPAAEKLFPVLSGKLNRRRAIDSYEDIEPYIAMDEADSRVYVRDERMYRCHGRDIPDERHTGSIGRVYIFMDRTDMITAEKNELEYQDELRRDAAEKTEQLRKQYEVMENVFVYLVENRNHVESHYEGLVADLTEILLRKLKKTGYTGYNISEQYIADSRLTVPLHDIGMISIPEEIIEKPGKLSPSEYEIIKGHVSSGLRLIKDIYSDTENAAYYNECVNVVRNHHERWDGKGYPAGLYGKRIPFIGRVTAIIDTYTALTSPRPYRDRVYTVREALDIIKKEAGRQFDPELVEAFVSSEDEIMKATDTALKVLAGGGLQ